MILLARVVQPNLIFVVGLPTWISKDKEILKGQNYFGRYGKIFKVEVNQNQTFGGPQGQPSFSAYITYYRAEDAMRSIRDLNQSTLHGRPIRVSLGTTKYCSQFLRGTKCTKHECMYLHELGDSAASFTKEEMQAGKHTEYMNKLLQDFCQSKSYSLDSQKEETTILGSLDSSVSSPNDASVPHTSESSSYSNGRNRFRFEDTSMLSVENSGVQVSDRCTTQSDQTSASLKEIRKLRHTNKDNSNAVSVSDTSLADKSKLNYNNSNKPSSWNHSSSISSSDYPTRKLGKNSFGTFHFKNSSENTNTDKSYVEGTKGNHVRHHNSTQNRILLPRSIPSNQVSTRTEPICTSSNGCHRTWCRPNPENSSNIQPLLGDEPADIDFDPFRESQQGLAELLAAEVSRLNVSEPLFSHRVCLTNGSSVGISHCPSEPQSSSLDTRLPQANFSLNSAQAEKLRSWYSNIVSHNRSNHVDPNKSFNNNNNATNNSSFCCNTGLTDMDSHPTSTNSASSFTWQLDDPAILSSRLSSSNSTVKNNQISSTDLLEQIWRTTPHFQSFFDPSLASTAAAASSSSYISQSGVKNQSRQQPLPPTGDTIIHPSSHSQLKE
uniref:CCR4-NOT transcription complex subunit 4 n=1 Tax=Schistosoma haematobium TaxID=6185 RepID=A0A095C2Z2_SCHHA